LVILGETMNKNLILIIFLIGSTLLYSQRIKDIAIIGDQSSEQIIGYGLVVGLAGSGDSHRSSFTVQSVTSMLERFGITVPQAQLKTRNVAAVMVTATINSFLKPGSNFDVNVSSLGDAKSLSGGTLLMTPLSGIQGKVYGFAQGSVSVGGYDVQTQSGGRAGKNHTLAGRVPRGGSLKASPAEATELTSEIKLFLKEPDLSTSDNLAKAVNGNFGDGVAKAIDASEVMVTVPVAQQNNIVEFLAQLESLEVETDFGAKVVLNERTGTVVAGNNVIIKPVTISHGGLNINIKSYPIISQPNSFSQGRTAIFNNLVPEATQDTNRVVALDRASNVQEVATALNSLNVTPQDIIAIFQAIKEAGALVGELIIL
jgi:flagellar P-ring protein precursor FlgI